MFDYYKQTLKYSYPILYCNLTIPTRCLLVKMKTNFIR